LIIRQFAAQSGPPTATLREAHPTGFPALFPGRLGGMFFDLRLSERPGSQRKLA
jgi:hypothetical protein